MRKQKVKDAVDKAKPDLPSDLPNPPQVIDINFADFPILYVNLSGDFDLARLQQSCVPLASCMAVD